MRFFSIFKRNLLPFSILIFAVLFNAIFLLPEITQISPDQNDNVMHYSLSLSAQNEFEAGGNPIDHWVNYWSMGFPVFHYYPHFSHLLVVAVYHLLLRKIPLFFVYHLIAYLLLVFYPLAVYWGMRKMAFSRLDSACIALFSLTMSNINGYGFELISYLWRGSGMFTQLTAMFLFPISLGLVYGTIKRGGRIIGASLGLAAVFLSNLTIGVAAIYSIFPILLSVYKKEKLFDQLKRTLLALAVFLGLVSYFVIPILFNSQYQAHSLYDFREKWDSYGAKYVISQLFNGNLFDFGRLPVVTLLAGFGFLLALSRRRPAYRFAAYGFIFWLLLYFGRPFWGGLLKIFPMSAEMHWHRFIAMVQLFGAMLAGIMLSNLVKFVGVRFKYKFSWIAAPIIIILIALPVFWERAQFIAVNNIWIRDSRTNYLGEKNDFETIVTQIKQLPPGRVYPGLRANWGSNFKVGSVSVFYVLSDYEIPALSFLPDSWALPGDFVVNFNEYNPAHYDLFNVKYVIAPDGKTFPSFVKKAGKAGKFNLYTVKTSGYFDLVNSPVALYGDKNSIWAATLLWLRSPMSENKNYLSVYFDRNDRDGYDKKLFCRNRYEYCELGNTPTAGGRIDLSRKEFKHLLSVNDPLDTLKYKKSVPGKVLSEEAGRDRYAATVQADNDCWLLFKMTYHPGWRALCDGVEEKTVILSPGFIGVKIDKGRHTVVFDYRAPGYKNYLLALGLALAVGMFLFERKKP